MDNRPTLEPLIDQLTSLVPSDLTCVDAASLVHPDTLTEKNIPDLLDRVYCNFQLISIDYLDHSIIESIKKWGQNLDHLPIDLNFCL
jgi:hypothetical protein